MAHTPEVALELRRAVMLRANELHEMVQHLRGPLGRSRSSLRTALDVVERFPAELRTTVELEWERNADPGSRALILTSLLRRANLVADVVEKHLAHGTRRELSEALVDEICREIAVLRLRPHEVVISHGDAANFETTFGADLTKVILGGLTTASSPGTPLIPFAFFRIPRIEGAGVQWRPVLLGHEVAHIAVHDRGAVSAFDLTGKFDFHQAEYIPNPKARPGSVPLATAMGLYNIAEAWVVELICDAHALHRFGPAAVASLGEYFTAIGAMDSLNPSHPPGLLRLRLLLESLGPIHDPRLAAVVRPWADLVPTVPSLAEPWADHLVEMFLANAAELPRTLEHLDTPGYDYADRSAVVGVLADRMQSGIPGCEVVAGPPGTFSVAVDADVVNAVWVGRVEGCDLPLDSLGKKALESLDFLRRWVAEGGTVPWELHTAEAAPPGVLPGEEGVAALSAPLIARRLRVDDDRRLVVAPLVHAPKGTGLDLRLGNRFIVFRRTGTAAFDPLSADDDPRAVQVHVELSWTEQFVLHPQEVVLGASFEYIVLPADLTGQVITRSSYGRLGLLSATAVQIHPRFHGCLTLELVNLSTIPITLTPGERIAQLVLWRTLAIAEAEEKYNHPIGPQFSRVRDDPEADVLRSLRDQ